jgi:hypothetical protein
MFSRKYANPGKIQIGQKPMSHARFPRTELFYEHTHRINTAL